MKLVFATRNRNKIEEVSLQLGGVVDVLSLDELGYYNEIEETGTTLNENALLKARTLHALFNGNVFSDDSGLEIDALNGAPGVISAIFAGPDKDASKNMAKVLKLLEGETNRSARFKTVIALIINNQEFLFEGVVEGTILHEPVGQNGFGYDPIFKPDGFNCSFAEMQPDVKSRVSHRSKAVSKLVEHINSLNK